MAAVMFGAISGDWLINLIVWIFIWGAILGILWLLNENLPFPEIVKKIVRIVIMVGGAFLLINALLTLIGHPIVRW